MGKWFPATQLLCDKTSNWILHSVTVHSINLIQKLVKKSLSFDVVGS